MNKSTTENTFVIYTSLCTKEREKWINAKRFVVRCEARGRDKESLNNKSAVVWWLNNPIPVNDLNQKNKIRDLMWLHCFPLNHVHSASVHIVTESHQKWQCRNFWNRANFMQIMKTIFFSYQFTPNKDHPTSKHCALLSLAHRDVENSGGSWNAMLKWAEGEGHNSTYLL